MNDARSNEPARRAIAGLFYETVQAEVALTELKAAGYRDAELSEVASVYGSTRSELPAVAPTEGATYFREHETRSSAFASELLALDFGDADAHDLVASIVRGKTLVVVDTAPLGAGPAEAIFERHHATISYSSGVAPAFQALEEATEYAPEMVAESTAVSDSAAGIEPGDSPEGVLELREERLVVEKETIAYAETSVSKRVVTEMQTIEVPVTREELVIERVPVSGEAAADPIAAGGAGEQIVIPLTREVVSVEKRVVPIVEVTVGVRRVEGVEHVAETVRHEELVVERDGNGEREP